VEVSHGSWLRVPDPQPPVGAALDLTEFEGDALRTQGIDVFLLRPASSHEGRGVRRRRVHSPARMFSAQQAGGWTFTDHLSAVARRIAIELQGVS